MSESSRARWEQQRMGSDVRNIGLESFKRQLADLFVRAERSDQAEVEMFMVSSEEARYLLSLSGGNRERTKTDVENYRRKVEDGLWETTNQGIGFIKGRVFHDGHARAEGISLTSGVYVRVQITVNMEPTVVRAIDVGIRIKSNRDVSRMEFGEHISGKDQSRINAYNAIDKQYKDFGRIPYEEFVVAKEKCRAALDALKPVAPNNKLIAPGWGALMFAWEAYPDQVIKFARHLSDPNADGTPSPVRTFVLWAATAETAGFTNARNYATHMLYALRAFVEGESLRHFSVPFVKDESGARTRTYEWRIAREFFDKKRTPGKRS